MTENKVTNSVKATSGGGKRLFMLERPCARIVWSSDGGPIRRVLTGRAAKPTGFMPCVKANGRGMPWESRDGERPLLVLCEVGTSVTSLMAQPHRLEIPIANDTRPEIYIPDLYVLADRGLAKRLLAGERFGPAILHWSPNMTAEPTDSKLVIEVKTAKDHRQFKRSYRNKLALVREVYSRAGYQFIEVGAENDFGCIDLSAPHRVWNRRGARFDAVHAHRAVRYLQSAGRRACLGGLVEAIGASISVAFALHVRRLLSIDLRSPLTSSTGVCLLTRSEEG